MNYFFVIILNCSMAALSFAERVSFPNLTDQTTHQLFNELNQFESTPQNVSSIQVAVNAMSALLDTVSLRIKNLSKYTGVFSGNCSVFFDKTLDFAACDLAASDSPVVGSALLLKESKRLPEAYWQQISLNNILLATVVGDWRRGVLERYQTDLFFKQGSCTGSETSTLSQIATQTASLSLPKTLTGSVSSSDSNSASRSLTETNSETFDSGTVSKSLTQSQSATQSHSHFDFGCSATTPPVTGLLAAWNQAGGTYADTTNQTGRYNLSNGIVTDTLTNIQWQQNASTAAMNFTDAATYCAAQTTGGLSDWRVPNVIELQTLVDFKNSVAPYLNRVAFPGAPVSNCWSSTSEVGNGGGNAWGVEFSNLGQSFAPTNTTANKVRCLRSCYLPPIFRYTMLSGEVTDQVTGLIWQKISTGGSMNQTNAISYCAKLVLNGHSWRLPTVKELSTLIDYNVTFNSLMMNSIFAGESTNTFWTSTSVAVNPGNAWHVDFRTGGVALFNAFWSYSVRCVRSCSLPPTTGLLAAWSASSGVYSDITNQTDRYNISNGIVTDTITEIQWQQNASTATMNFTDAATYCASQTTGGLNGWRVPNIVELGTLVDFTKTTAPYVNGVAFPGAPASDYWSASLDIGNAGYAWTRHFGSGGGSYPATTNTSNFVRCARSCYPIPPTARYTIGSGVVMDIVTGLIWQKTAPTGYYTQENAMSYCTAFSVGGYSSGWRLPRVRELESLVDYGQLHGTLMMNQRAFSGEPANWYWSSSSVVGNPATGWHVAFYAGAVDDGVAAVFNIRCVRSANQTLDTNCSSNSTGLMYIWPQTTGIYVDVTNQASRYFLSNGVVNDTLTGLQWESATNTTTMNWTVAISYCSARTTGTLSNWRLPNVDELQTLVDYTRSNPSINATAFPGTLNNYWSSTASANTVGDFWVVSFVHSYPSGDIFASGIVGAFYVRCVH